MVDHTEVFWSLFAVDMDALIEMQPPDTWDSFPLFMLLNDYLRSSGNLRLVVFHFLFRLFCEVKLVDNTHFAMFIVE